MWDIFFFPPGHVFLSRSTSRKSVEEDIVLAIKFVPETKLMVKPSTEEDNGGNFIREGNDIDQVVEIALMLSRGEVTQDIMADKLLFSRPLAPVGMKEDSKRVWVGGSGAFRAPPSYCVDGRIWSLQGSSHRHCGHGGCGAFRAPPTYVGLEAMGAPPTHTVG